MSVWHISCETACSQAYRKSPIPHFVSAGSKTKAGAARAAEAAGAAGAAEATRAAGAGAAGAAAAAAAMSNQFKDAYGATRWLFPVYFCETGFLLHTPIFLIASPKKPVKETSTEPFLQRMKDAFGKMFDRRKRRLHLIAKKSPIYGRFELAHHILFVLRMVCNIIGVALIVSGTDSVSSEENRITQNVWYSLTATPNASIGWGFLLASFILLVTAYAHHRYFLTHALLHKQSPVAKVKPALFQICHLSVINFFLDIPGVAVQPLRFNRYIQLALNFTAFLMLFIVVEERPFVVSSPATL